MCQYIKQHAPTSSTCDIEHFLSRNEFCCERAEQAGQEGKMVLNTTWRRCVAVKKPNRCVFLSQRFFVFSFSRREPVSALVEVKERPKAKIPAKVRINFQAQNRFESSSYRSR